MIDETRRGLEVGCGAFPSVPQSGPPKQNADHALRHVALPEQWSRAGQIQR